MVNDSVNLLNLALKVITQILRLTRIPSLKIL